MNFSHCLCSKRLKDFNVICVFPFHSSFCEMNLCLKWFYFIGFLLWVTFSITLEIVFASSHGRTHFLSASLSVLIFPSLLLWPKTNHICLSWDSNNWSLWLSQECRQLPLFLTLSIVPLDLCLSLLVDSLFEYYDPTNQFKK